MVLMEIGSRKYLTRNKEIHFLKKYMLVEIGRDRPYKEILLLRFYQLQWGWGGGGGGRYSTSSFLHSSCQWKFKEIAYTQNGSCVPPNFQVSCPTFECRIRRFGNNLQRFAPNVPTFRQNVRANLSNSFKISFGT